MIEKGIDAPLGDGFALAGSKEGRNAKPNRVEVPHHWRDRLYIQGQAYDIWLGEGAIKLEPCERNLVPLHTPPKNASFVVCDEGRCCASLQDGVLQIAWLNRYAPEIHPWRREEYGLQPLGKEQRLQGARLLAVSMRGQKGIRGVASTETRTVVFHCEYDGKLGFETEDPCTNRPSYAAQFSGRCVMLKQDIVGVAQPRPIEW